MKAVTLLTIHLFQVTHEQTTTWTHRTANDDHGPEEERGGDDNCDNENCDDADDYSSQNHLHVLAVLCGHL